jgi:hypothetical protein
MKKRKLNGPNWLQIEVEYRAGEASVRAIARAHRVSDGAIRHRAKTHGWVRKEITREPEAVRNEAVTPERRRQVALLRADGMQEAAIAVVLGIDVDHLRRDFSLELIHAADIARATAILRLDHAAENGNASAIRRQEEMTSFFPPARAPVSASTRPLGKKAQAQIVAETASDGTSWEKLFEDQAGRVGEPSTKPN